MKNNKKGFTLIELLAVIVILAIIMVIAVPQILNVINSSRTSAWNDNVKMIEKAIETNEALLGTGMAASNGTVSVLASGGCTDTNIRKVADVAADTAIQATPSTNPAKCTITLTGNTDSTKGGTQFSGQASKTLTCDSTGCQ